MENVIIIGGGPTGLSAAIYLARAGLKPLVFAGSPPGGQLTLTSEVENYPGFESILGTELVTKFRNQAIKFGARIVDENVLNVDFSKKPFLISPASSGSVEISQSQLESAKTKTDPTDSNRFQPIPTSSVLIATGAKALWLGLESETRLRGKGVSACATCDGFFFKNKVVGVVGGGDTAMEEALTLTKFANKVYLIHRRDSFRASKIMTDRVLHNPKVEVIYNAVVEEVLGKTKVEGVKIKSETRSTKSETNSKRLENSNLENSDLFRDSNFEIRNLKLDGVFVAIGHKPDTDLFVGKVELDSKGYIYTSDRVAFENIKYQISKIKKTNFNTFDKLSASQFQPILTNFNFSYQSSTSVPGVFAAGDCVDYIYRQAATAVGMGVATALDIEKYLEQH